MRPRLEDAYRRAKQAEDEQAKDEHDGANALLDEREHDEHNRYREDARIDGLEQIEDDEARVTDGHRPVERESYRGGRHAANHHDTQDRCGLRGNLHKTAVIDGVDEARAQRVAGLEQEPLENGLCHTVEQDEDERTRQCLEELTERIW